MTARIVNPTSTIRPPRTLLLAALALAAVVAPSPAHAISGFYTEVAVGYGKFNGDQLIFEEQPMGEDVPFQAGADGCCAKGGIAGDLRIGYSLFGIAGEFGMIANGWDLGSNTGGGGIIGGGLKLFPLNVFTLVGFDTSDFPLDIGIGVLFGWAIVGKEFAYSGFATAFDLSLTYKLASFLSAGLKVDFAVPKFGDFVYTDYKNNRGRCLDSGGNQVLSATEDTRHQKGMPACSGGTGPDATFVAVPLVVLNFHLDLFE